MEKADQSQEDEAPIADLLAARASSTPAAAAGNIQQDAPEDRPAVAPVLPAGQDGTPMSAPSAALGPEAPAVTAAPASQSDAGALESSGAATAEGVSAIGDALPAEGTSKPEPACPAPAVAVAGSSGGLAPTGDAAADERPPAPGPAKKPGKKRKQPSTVIFHCCWPLPAVTGCMMIWSRHAEHLHALKL